MWYTLKFIVVIIMIYDKLYYTLQFTVVCLYTYIYIPQQNLLDEKDEAQKVDSLFHPCMNAYTQTATHRKSETEISGTHICKAFGSMLCCFSSA